MEMERRATPQLVLLLVLLFAVLTTLVASNNYFQGRSLAVHDRAERIVRNTERIRLYDEVLTGSARLAAATGDAAYERRYHRIAPQLDAVIADTLRLANSAEAAAAIASTSDANQALITMEERSFELGRRGHERAALALLDSPRYRQQKEVYAQGSRRAENVFRSVVRRNTAQVRRYRPLALGIGILGGAVLLVAGVVILRLARERERLGLEHVARTRNEADRRAVEVEYFETQHSFSDILQVTRQESEANTLIKRHLEQAIPGASVTVTNRNNSDNRLEVMTELLAESPLHETFAGAEPSSCAAVRLGRAHEREPERASLLECELCGRAVRAVAVHPVTRRRRGDRLGPAGMRPPDRRGHAPARSGERRPGGAGARQPAQPLAGRGPGDDGQADGARQPALDRGHPSSGWRPSRPER
jgi:hypothetical protein